MHREWQFSAEIAYPATQRWSSGTRLERHIEGTFAYDPLKTEMCVGEPSSAVEAVESCLLWKQSILDSEVAIQELAVLSKKVRGTRI